MPSPPHDSYTLADQDYDWECWQRQNTPDSLDWSRQSSTSTVDSLSSRSRRRNGPIYIGQHLAWLESKDANCVCILRKIHKLKSDAAEIICEYFRQWGPVEKIL